MKYKLINIFILIFIGCNNAENIEVQEEKDTLDDIYITDNNINLNDTTVETYIKLIEKDEISFKEYLRIAEKIGKNYTGIEKLEILKVCYNKDSSNIKLNLRTSSSYLFAYYYEGGEDKKNRAEEILDYTLNFDTEFNNYKEFGIDQESLKKFYKLWNKTNDKENLMTWVLLEHFNEDSDIYRKVIRDNW